MGSLFKPKQPAPPPPAPPVLVRDEVSGVEQIPVTNPDGSTTYVTRAIPLTPQQQAERDSINKIVADSLAEINRLSRADYAPDTATQQVLDAWQQQQEKLLAQSTTQRTQQEEERLASRGLADSTAAQDIRRQRALDEQNARSTLALSRTEMGNQIRGEKLALQQNLFSTVNGMKDATQAQTARAATAGLSSAVALNAQRQASILDYYNAQNRNSADGAFGQALGRSLGGTIGNTVGGSAGGLLGSWLFGRK
jgi:hypothetical protein